MVQRHFWLCYSLILEFHVHKKNDHSIWNCYVLIIHFAQNPYISVSVDSVKLKYGTSASLCVRQTFVFFRLKNCSFYCLGCSPDERQHTCEAIGVIKADNRNGWGVGFGIWDFSGEDG